ncbi:TonB-dependent receptor domain-containing protein [Aestuariibacter salexigens]|uniref:TonB-dependent receptor domain-containing protein n=1 Tax=Aestuariibacter salexigens TaxID=226010 RepID=UPI00041230AF|nr:TonB-dependent receptor [Aestuariibacter salexigens]
MRRFPFSVVSIAVLGVISASVANAQQTQKQRDEQTIEQITITATPLNRTVLETAQPVSVLAGEDLRNNQAATLGETLNNVPGVNSTYFGPVSSSPVIRGLDGPRVKIVQNGLDASDASRVGPDHVVSTETSTATQVEVLRGPATLLYGSGAIGGVVNVVDNRLPRQRVYGLEGEAAYQFNSVADENLFNLSLDAGKDDFAFHIDAFDRDSDNYEIPGSAELGGEEENGELEGSSIEASGFTVGAGWIGDNARASFSYGRLDSLYGIPGHAHGEEHGDEHEDEHSEEEHAEEELVFADMQQDRFQAVLDWQNLPGTFKEVHWHNAYTDYQHSEIEDGMPGTTFANKTLESRLWTVHQPLDGWEGVIGLHYSDSEFEAIGDEAYTPPVDTRTIALFVLEEKRVGNFLWQLGARIEDAQHTPDNSFYTADEDHGEEINFSTMSFTALSASAGTVWTIDEQSSVAINYAYSQRAPSAAEIFSNGLHISTSTYEVGVGFEIEAEEDGFHIEQSTRAIEKEVSNNLDLTYRYVGEHVTFMASLFYNDVADYLFQQDTGLYISGEDVHGHEEEDEEHAGEHADEHGDEHADEHDDDLPVFIFQQQDAKLYGFEAELDWHLDENWRIDVFADYTRAKLDSGNVPRIPAMRFGAELHYEADNWHAELSATRYAKQDNIAAYETETEGYTLVSASVNYYTQVGNNELIFFLKGNNLTDQEARVHQSFLKDEAPLPGRAVTTGVRLSF